MVLWALLLRGQLAEYLKMARLAAFVGIVVFFAIAAWWSNNTSRLDCSVLAQPISPVMQEACLGRSMEQTVPVVAGTHHNLVVTGGEELSRRGEGPHLDDDDWAGSGSIVKWFRRLRFPLPSTSEGIQKRWQDTYRLDCSELGKPLVGPVRLSRSWRRYLRPMKQNNRTCAINACTMAIEGMHCKVYESFHGPNTFPDAWKAAEDWTNQLLSKCNADERIYKGGDGFVVGDVLYKIQNDLLGVRTASGVGQQEVMPLDKYTKHSGKELTRERVAELLDQGPCIGRLFACPWYKCFEATKNDNWVYRGSGRDKATRDDCKSRYPDDKDIMGSHAVVCFQYRVCENGEMHVCVLDNHSDDGPERWVHIEELDALYSLKVDCLCGSPKHYHDAGASGKGHLSRASDIYIQVP